MIKWSWISRKKYNEVLERERGNESHYREEISNIYKRWSDEEKYLLGQHEERIEVLTFDKNNFSRMYYSEWGLRQEALQENARLQKELSECWTFINKNHSNKHHSLKQKRVKGRFSK